jgi:type I restriction-modification system DNA methylase subunit
MSELASPQPFLRDVPVADRLRVGRRLLILVALARLARAAGHPRWREFRDAAVHGRDFRDVRANLQSLGKAIEEVRPELGHIFTDVLVEEAFRAGGALPEHAVRAFVLLEGLDRFAPDERTFGRWFDLASDEATGAGRSAFAHVTPRALAQLVVGLIGIEPDQRVFDPSCGNGTLLSAVRETCPTARLYGQDVDPLAVAFTTLRLNLIGTAAVKLGDALRATPFTGPDSPALFDRIVCDPPLGAIMDVDNLPARLAATARDARRSETLFAALSSDALTPNGRAAIVVPRSFLVRKGPEAELRSDWLRRDIVEGVVSLPPGVLPWAKVELAVLVLARQKRADHRERVIFVDGSRSKVATSRSGVRLRSEDVQTILAAYRNPMTNLHATSIHRGSTGAAAQLEPSPFFAESVEHFDLDLSRKRIGDLTQKMHTTAARMDILFDRLKM